MQMNFEYMYRNENNNIIKNINDIVLTTFFVDVVSTITKDIEGWQIEYIFKEDDVIHNPPKTNIGEQTKKGNKAHAILMDGETWKSATAKKEIDLKDLDLAALLRLLEYRLLCVKDYCYVNEILRIKEMPDTLKKLFTFMRKDFRNLSSHTSLSDLETVFANNIEVSKKLEELKKNLEEASSDCERYLVKGQDIKRIFDIFIINQLSPIQKDFNKAKIGNYIKYDSEKNIDIKDLATYNIIVDYTVFLQKDGYNGVRALIESGKCLFAEQTLLERLKSTQIQGELADKETAKDIIGTLLLWTDNKDKVPNLILLKNASVIYKLQEVKETKWCVITFDSHLANEVWNLEKKNVIALKPQKRATFEIYKKTRDTLSEDNSIDEKFKVEVMLEAGETRLNETINMVESDWYDEEYIDKTKNIQVAETAEKKSDETRIAQYNEAVEEYIFDNDDIPETGMAVYIGVPKNSGRYKLAELISEGGEGKIYEYEDDETKYAKIYKKGQLTPLKAKKIEALVARKGDFDNTNVCCPQNILCHPRHWDKKVIVGYSMRKAIKKGKRTLGTIRQVILRIVKGDKEYEQWKRKDLVLICYKCSLLFEELHKKNILMGDVNPDNIMVDEDKNVYFIDTDSYQIEGFNCPVGTIEFTSPELLKKMDEKKQGYENVERTINDEKFAVAVLYFYILFLSEFPYNINADMSTKECILKHNFRFKKEKKNGKEIKRNYIWKNLTKELQEMFMCNFAEAERFDDNKWTAAFNNMLENIYDENSKNIESKRKLSNEIFPYSAIEKEGEEWESLVCTSCKNPYKIARFVGTPLLLHEKECPRCKEIKKMMQKRIYKLICPKCKDVWTINEWDINGRDVDELYCPDCDENFYFSRKAEFEEKTIEEDLLKKSVERQMSFALRKYKEELN